MDTNSQDSQTTHDKKPSGINRLVDQWGGKVALFFTYTHFSHDLAAGLLTALLPFIREDFKLNYLQAGFLVSAYALTSGLSQLLGGWVSDRIGSKKAMAIGLGGVGISALVMSLAPSYTAIVVVLIAMGILAGFYHPSAIATVSNMFESKKTGRAVAMHGIGGSLGFGIGPIFCALIASRLNWHFAFLIMGIPSIVAAVLVITRLKMPKPFAPNKGAANKSEKKEAANVWQVFKPAIGIIAISVAMALISGPVISFAPLFLIDVYHISNAAGTMWMTMIRMGSLVGSLMGGWLSDKFGRRNTILVILTVFGPLAFALAKIPMGFGLAAVYFIFGAVMSTREIAMQTFLMDSTPAKLRATVMGIYFGFGQQGNSIIQPVAGNFMDMIGIGKFFLDLSYISIALSAATVVIAIRYFRGKKNTPETTPV